MASESLSMPASAAECRFSPKSIQVVHPRPLLSSTVSVQEEALKFSPASAPLRFLFSQVHRQRHRSSRYYFACLIFLFVYSIVSFRFVLLLVVIRSCVV